MRRKRKSPRRNEPPRALKLNKGATILDARILNIKLVMIATNYISKVFREFKHSNTSINIPTASESNYFFETVGHKLSQLIQLLDLKEYYINEFNHH